MGSGPLGVDEWNGGFSLLLFRVSRREKRYAVGAEESLLRQISTPRKVAIASPIGRGYAGRHVGRRVRESAPHSCRRSASRGSEPLHASADARGRGMKTLYAVGSLVAAMSLRTAVARKS